MLPYFFEFLSRFQEIAIVENLRKDDYITIILYGKYWAIRIYYVKDAKPWVYGRGSL